MLKNSDYTTVSYNISDKPILFLQSYFLFLKGHLRKLTTYFKL